jgi:hypothetical protein
MASVLDRLLGVPVSRARQREEIDLHLRFRSADSLRLTLNDNISHMTEKSGALLAAQAIFIVVDTYGVDHGWPRAPVLVSILSLILAALLLMFNLRSVYLPPETGDEPSKLEHHSLVQLARLLGLRGARFNVALYLTFLSVVLLGFGAFEGAMAP